MSTFSSPLVPICTILLAAEEKKCFPKKLRKKIHTYISMTLLFSCSRFTSPSSEDGNKKVPFVCLFVAVLTIRKKDKKQRQKNMKKVRYLHSLRPIAPGSHHLALRRHKHRWWCEIVRCRFRLQERLEEISKSYGNNQIWSIL